MKRWLNIAALGAAAVVGPPAAVAADGWQKVENPPPVTGLDGLPHSATCSGFPGTNPTFSYWVKPGASSNLMIYFVGGGACWDDLTCSNPFAPGSSSPLQFYTAEIDPGLDPALVGGVFSNQAANPVRDWTQVVVPYCTGDVHGGSATRTYTQAARQPTSEPTTFTLQHRGFDNFMVVMDWVRKNVSNPAKVLVAGSSAGGYGASINFPWVQALYPNADFSVMADASQGVATPAFDLGMPGRGSWNLQFLPSVFGPDPAQVPTPDLLARAARALPQVKVSQFTTNYDVVQTQFYLTMKLNYPPGGNCKNVFIDWNQQMGADLKDTAPTTPNFRYYVAAGSYHTILTDSTMYSEKSAGPAFDKWLSAMIASPGLDGLLWRNVACPACVRKLPCS